MKLKPCPFCGGEAVYYDLGQNYKPDPIPCSLCGAVEEGCKVECLVCGAKARDPSVWNMRQFEISLEI